MQCHHRLPSISKEMINIHEVTEHVTELFKYDADNLGVSLLKTMIPVFHNSILIKIK